MHEKNEHSATEIGPLAAPYETLIGKLAFRLTRAGYYLATAESCTGGMIASICTEVSGSSGWFKGGIVAYANDVKHGLLGVPLDILQQHGAVSGEVVERMALGALKACGAQAAVAVSGVAGPTGGTPEKPVGTVWIAVAVLEQEDVCAFSDATLAQTLPGCTRARSGERDAVVHVMRYHFDGPRSAVRRQTAEKALADLLALLDAGGV